LLTRNSMCTLQNQAQISTPRRRFDYDAYIKGRLEGRYVVIYIEDEVAVNEADPIILTEDIKVVPEDIEENSLQVFRPDNIESPRFDIYIVNKHQRDDLIRTASLSYSLSCLYAISINCRGGPTTTA
jgi:hypothetical protein